MSSSPLSRTVTVINPQGLHARPADLLVRLANQFESTISIGIKNGEVVDCKSILNLLTLAAAKGTTLTLSASGTDAAEALRLIGELFEAGFDEMEEMQGATDAE